LKLFFNYDSISPYCETINNSRFVLVVNGKYKIGD